MQPATRPSRSSLRTAGLFALALLTPLPRPATAEPIEPLMTVAPDGIAYPDFSRAGRSAPIPDLPVLVEAADFGVVCDDDGDDAPGLQAAVDAAAAMGRPGAVLLAAGRHELDGQVVVSTPGVVIRGAGVDATVLIPRFAGQPLDEQGSAPRTPLLHFIGAKHPVRPKGPLAAPARRGDTAVTLDDAAGVEPGQGIYIATRRPDADILEMLSPQLQAYYGDRYQRTVEGNWMKAEGVQDFARVVAVEGNVVTLDRPLRSAYPMANQPFFDVRYAWLDGVGLEGLSITQPDETKTQVDAVHFERVSNGWIRNVDLGPIGSWPLRIVDTVDSEFHDSRFHGSYARGGGGVGYVGFDTSFDNVMDGCHLEDLRHLSFSFLSAGNVVRRTVLRNVDVNFHLEWPAETLFEECDIDAGQSQSPPGTESHGTYGYGMYTPRYYNDQHLPAGRRIVYFNNKVVSPKIGIELGGGGSSGNVFAYNLFDVQAQAAILLRRGADDNLFARNTFVLRDWEQLPNDWDLSQIDGSNRRYKGLDERFSYVPGAIVFISGPSRGNRLEHNRFYGVPEAKLVVGVREPVKLEGNFIDPEVPAVLPEAQEPPFPSLYDWQRSTR